MFRNTGVVCVRVPCFCGDVFSAIRRKEFNSLKNIKYLINFQLVSRSIMYDYCGISSIVLLSVDGESNY